MVELCRAQMLRGMNKLLTGIGSRFYGEMVGPQIGSRDRDLFQAHLFDATET